MNFRCCSIFDAGFTEASYDVVYDSGCFHHLPPHRRRDYAALVRRALKPGGSYGLVCFRPEGGSGYTDLQVYERASLGGGLGYSADRLRALWDKPPFSIRVLRQMKKADRQGPWFGEDLLWALLATTDGCLRSGSAWSPPEALIFTAQTSPCSGALWTCPGALWTCPGATGPTSSTASWPRPGSTHTPVTYAI